MPIQPLQPGHQYAGPRYGISVLSHCFYTGYTPASQVALITPIQSSSLVTSFFHLLYPSYFCESFLFLDLKKTTRHYANSCSCCTPPLLISCKTCFHLLLGFYLSVALRKKKKKDCVRNTRLSVFGSGAVRSNYVHLTDGNHWPSLLPARYGEN